MEHQAALPAPFYTIDAEIKLNGFAFRPGKETSSVLKDRGVAANWRTFASSWDDLGLDLYMADGGRYRRRRFAAGTVDRDGQ